MRYLIIILFISCNQSRETANTVNVPIDSATQLVGSFKDSLSIINSSLSDYVDNVQARINKLENENAKMSKDLGENVAPVRYALKATRTDSSYRVDYSGRIEELERENARLRKRIATDSTYIARMNKTSSLIEEIEKPNPNSLIVQPVPSNNIDVYLIPYSKKAKKKLMVYEAACDLSLINDLGGKLSSNYKGQHFFNDVLPGKYIVKLCTYFGNYQVIERTQDKQVIVMATSPPIK